MTYCIGTEECGCEIRQLHDGAVYIAWCKKHFETDRLFTELKEANATIHQLCKKIKEA